MTKPEFPDDDPFLPKIRRERLTDLRLHKIEPQEPSGWCILWVIILGLTMLALLIYLKETQ